MSKLIYFITPGTIVKISSKAPKFIPVLGPTFEYTKKAKKMTDLSNPVSASSRGVGLLFKSCFGKTGAISLESVLWLGFSTLGGVTANPTLIAVGAQFGNMLAEELIN